MSKERISVQCAIFFPIKKVTSTICKAGIQIPSEPANKLKENTRIYSQRLERYKHASQPEIREIQTRYAQRQRQRRRQKHGASFESFLRCQISEKRFSDSHSFHSQDLILPSLHQSRNFPI